MKTVLKWFILWITMGSPGYTSHSAFEPWIQEPQCAVYYADFRIVTVEHLSVTLSTSLVTMYVAHCLWHLADVQLAMHVSRSIAIQHAAQSWFGCPLFITVRENSFPEGDQWSSFDGQEDGIKRFLVDSRRLLKHDHVFNTSLLCVWIVLMGMCVYVHD